MKETPEIALLISFWLHMLATVTWVGGLATLAFLVFPIARRALNADEFARLLRSINKRLDPLGWFGLSVLTVTGLIQMSANPNYEGFLAVNNPWAQAILLKHIAFFGILLTSAYQTWRIAPAIERAALLRAHNKGGDDLEALQQKETRLLWVNLILGLTVLLLTAAARVA